jgi:hypothetical protein
MSKLQPERRRAGDPDVSDAVGYSARANNSRLPRPSHSLPLPSSRVAACTARLRVVNSIPCPPAGCGADYEVGARRKRGQRRIRCRCPAGFLEKSKGMHASANSVSGTERADDGTGRRSRVSLSRVDCGRGGRRQRGDVKGEVSSVGVKALSTKSFRCPAAASTPPLQPNPTCDQRGRFQTRR